MSMFDKLKAYSRKPAAVILATVMATSTIPTTPIAQAVTAAYAAETSTSKTTSGESAKAEFNPSDVVTTISDWKGDNQELKFSVHVGKDAGYASATISKADIESLLKEHVKKEMASDFVYAPDGTNALSVAINNSLKEQKLDKDCSNPVVRQNEDGTYCVEPSIANVEYKLVSPSAEKIDDKGNVTVKRREGGDVQLEFQITSVTLSAKYYYNVTKTTVVEKPDTGSTGTGTGTGTGTETGGTGFGTGTGETTPGTVSDVTEGEGTPSVPPTETVKIKDSVAVKDVKPSLDGKNVNVTTGKLNFREYYENETASVPAAVTADNLMYKSGKREYTLTLGGKGLTGEVVNNNEKFFAASVSGANESQTLSIDPLKAFNNDEKDKCDPKTVTIEWMYPDGTSTHKTTTVTVPNIARKPVSVSLPGEKDNAYTYRLKDAEQDVVLKSANDAVRNQIKTDTGDDIKGDLFKSVTISGMQAESPNPDKKYNDTKISFDYADEALEKAYSNYQFELPTTVAIAVVAKADWKDTGITAYSDNGGNCSSLTESQYSAGKWLNGTNGSNTPVTFAWKSHKLAIDAPEDGSGEKFAETVDPKVTADGDFKSGITFFAVDGDGVVTKTTDVKFRRDTAAPVLETTELVSGFNTRNQKVHDSLTAKAKFVTDKLALNAFVVDPNGENASGLSSDPTVSYTYGKNSKSAGNENNGSGSLVSKKGNSFTYDLSGNSADQKVFAGNIKVSATDVAGNKMEKAVTEAKGQLKIAELELIQNASKPTVTAGFDNNNVQREANGRGYYNANRTFTITVTDPFGDYVREYDSDQVIATITDGNDTFNVTPHDLTDMGNDTYTFSYTFGAKGDADCKVSAVSYVNLANTPAVSTFSGDTFTIDKTAPKLNVSWNTEAAQNGKYYNAARTATITVEEHNFDPNLFKIEAPVSAGNGDEATPAQIGGWTSNGDTHTATVTFPGQGVYTLSVSGEDLASNKSESYTSPEFVIDTIKPKIDIQNVVNRTAYAGEVAPSAAVHDTNLADGTTIEVSKISYPLSKDDPNPYAGAAINTSATDKSVSYLNPAKTKGNDGVYTLTVQAIDLAGNTESEAVTWSVNRFGSTYVISDNTGKMLDQYLKSSKTTDVKVTEINPSGLDDNKTSVELTRDTKNTTLKSGDNYTTDSDTSSGWSEYNYTVSKSNYDKDGAYRVLFHSEDAAGNSSENTMEGKNAKKTGAAAEINFAVDDTAPIASFVDLASNGKYEESSHKAKVSFEDNLKLSKAQIKVNGKTVATFTADQLEKSPIREFTLDGSSSKQDVTVVAWDAAGNKSKELKATGVLVTNDSFVLWMNNLPLMIGTIVAIVVVAGGIYLVVAKKRKENEEN